MIKGYILIFLFIKYLFFKIAWNNINKLEDQQLNEFNKKLKLKNKYLSTIAHCLFLTFTNYYYIGIAIIIDSVVLPFFSMIIIMINFGRALKLEFNYAGLEKFKSIKKEARISFFLLKVLVDLMVVIYLIIGEIKQ